MNKVKALIALFMGMTAGVQICGYIWYPKPEKIIIAIACVVLAIVWIYRIEELPDNETEDEQTPNPSSQTQ